MELFTFDLNIKLNSLFQNAWAGLAVKILEEIKISITRAQRFTTLLHIMTIYLESIGHNSPDYAESVKFWLNLYITSPGHNNHLCYQQKIISTITLQLFFAKTV